jgi:DNA uptake protein ComE-like DNA-binding protein
MHVVGRLNVNTASRDDLKKVPGLDVVSIEYILETRIDGPLRDLETIPGITDEARAHLKLVGDSNFTRILQNPLRTLTASK